VGVSVTLKLNVGKVLEAEEEDEVFPGAAENP